MPYRYRAAGTAAGHGGEAEVRAWGACWDAVEHPDCSSSSRVHFLKQKRARWISVSRALSHVWVAFCLFYGETGWRGSVGLVCSAARAAHPEPPMPDARRLKVFVVYNAEPRPLPQPSHTNHKIFRKGVSSWLNIVSNLRFLLRKSGRISGISTFCWTHGLAGRGFGLRTRQKSSRRHRA